MIKKEEMPLCDVATTVQLVGSKWKLLIIRDLISGPKRTSQLKRSLAGVSQKVLTESLSSMIDDGLVDRIDLKKVPPHVEYQLTPLGESFLPVIESMRQWGKYYKSQL
ncbi:TPA: helix-turn-helix transcriptional regulator [Enterococcus faecalis]|uniref:winged helix-turn-helix transcriptional regulator n=1 Tax=Enterococcus sp. DIV0086 TaxID=2774655 RepID=UPI002986A141|nr:helix-turn-helix transcriptional regulator [Enterococcus faecalis]HBI1662559.1 helix-turn-helix transcriptional regulator [Enterococcus faecalis]HBI1677722.1 helix-turn-helix transcriptional regulator [Enterococcus faecalis]HBI1678274.1 helix-turn-helix transcriptional regulator [Enterococcus faecalis]HBI1686310.1 helix-turn-helix transcriptional regulator [Enterococcus faecalis]